MRAQRLFPIALSLVLSILMMACKDDPVAPVADPKAIEGVWMLESINGEDFSQDGTIWTFANGTSTVTDAETGCYQELTYTVSGNIVNGTYVEDDCSGIPAGTQQTATWSVSNNKLTMVSAGETSVLRRLTGNDRVAGSWYVTKYNGQALPQGAGINIFVYGSTFEFLSLAPGQSAPCLTRFSMVNTGSRLDIQVVEDACNQLEPGDTDQLTWTIVGTTLRLQSVDGTVMEAERI